MEHVYSAEQPSIPDLFNQVLENEPKLVTNFVPEDALSQKTAFLAGEINNPSHAYPKLEQIDYDERYRHLDRLVSSVTSHPDMNDKFTGTYTDFVEGYRKKTQFMELARDYKATNNDELRRVIKSQYMELNIDLYGEPDKVTFESLLHEQLNSISQKQLTGSADQLREELFTLVDYSPGYEVPERFKPSLDTVEWMRGIAETLYGNMLAHVPDQKTFNAYEIKQVFDNIITNEFDEAASGWRVDVEPAKAINVKATEKRVVIPEDRTDVSQEMLERLVVHELGVHVMRAITGSETDLHPLGLGLNDYYDAEEGLGMVMEQAVKGEFADKGVGHYITAGLAHHRGMDFRQTFEVKWRLAVLAKANEQTDVGEEDVAKARNAAYSGTMRIFRGTDDLPWFKDLSYYNGSVDMWRHLEEIRGDDAKFIFVLMGKANPANRQHERSMYETRTA